MTETAAGLNLQHILVALQGAPEPKPATWVLKQLPKQLQAPIAVIETLLTEAIASGQAFRFGKVEKALYWHSTPKTWVEQSLLKRLAGRMKSKGEVLGAVNALSTVKGIIPKSEVEGTFKGLVASRQIHSHPGYIGSRSALFSVAPLNPTDYLKDAIEKLAKKLSISTDELAALSAKVTFDEAPPAKAKAPSPLAETAEPEVDRILQAMHDVNPSVASGDVVLIKELRERLDHSFDKPTFDRAILDLAAQHKLTLHWDDHAGMKTDAERELLVRGANGKFYSVVSLRKPS